MGGERVGGGGGNGASARFKIMDNVIPIKYAQFYTL